MRMKTKFDEDSLIQDEASQQVDLPLNTELIFSDCISGTLNGISKETMLGIPPYTNVGPGVWSKEESRLDLEQSGRACEPSSSESDLNKKEGNVDHQSTIDDTNQDVNYRKEICRNGKKAKPGKADKKTWVSVSNKIKRMKGEEYKGRRTTEGGKSVFDVERQKRKLKPRCSCKISNRNNFKCMMILEGRRKEIFEDFWELDWAQRKIEVNHLVIGVGTHQKTIPGIESRRSNSLKYHLEHHKKGDRIRVCKIMFLNSTGLREWTVRNWVLKHQLEDQNGNDLRRNEEESIKSDNNPKIRQQERNDVVRMLITQSGMLT